MPTQQLLIKAFNRKFPDVKIIIITFYYPTKNTSYNWYGNSVISINGRNKLKIQRLLTWLKVWKIMIRIKQENHVIGLLSFWSTECAVVGNYFGKFYGIKHFTWLLGQDAKKDNKYIKFYKPKAESLIAISDSLAAEFYKNHGIRPKHIIYNGIEASLFPHEQSNRNIDILGAGSLIPLKQYNIFIQIVNSLRKDFPLLQAMICGGGPEEQNLKSQLKETGLEANIQLIGTLQHTETLLFMQQTKVFLHTSIYEGFSTACMEALFAGAHVVSFYYPLRQETQNWHVVKNQQEMTEKVKELLLDKNLKHERILIRTIDETAEKMMQLFE
ncbi:MAG: glycosyltransferase [Bacteroidia bacterium]